MISNYYYQIKFYIQQKLNDQIYQRNISVQNLLSLICKELTHTESFKKRNISYEDICNLKFRQVNTNSNLAYCYILWLQRY
ncbi:hypothetical protein pb186bvf_017942 [Paramecium bursaria]